MITLRDIRQAQGGNDWKIEKKFVFVKIFRQ